MKFKSSPQENGFSLIELMITLVIMTVVIGLILTMLAQMFRMSKATYKATDTQQGVRNAMEFITRDLLVTGDGLAQVSNIRVKDDFVEGHLSANPVAGTGELAQLGLVTSDVESPIIRFIPSPVAGETVGVRNDTDRISMMRVDPDFLQVNVNTGGNVHIKVVSGDQVTVDVPNSDVFNENEIYLFTNGMSAALGTITSIAENTLIFNDGADPHQMNKGGADGAFHPLADNRPVAIMRVQLVQYFVSDDNLLIRRVYGIADRGFADSVIAENVTNLQINYRIDRQTGTNIIDSTDRITVDEQDLIRDVEFTITGQPPVEGELPYTISSSSSTGIRNLEFREALQPGASAL